MICLAVLLASPVLAQDRPPLRRIDPERFPDYGIAAPTQTPVVSQQIEVKLPDAEHPLGVCDRAMPTSLWLRCLRDTAAMTDDELGKAGARIKQGFEARTDITDVLRKAWSRAIDESLVRWRTLRDYECQQLAMAEPDAPKELFEARLICAIVRNRARAAEISARFSKPR